MNDWSKEKRDFIEIRRGHQDQYAEMLSECWDAARAWSIEECAMVCDKAANKCREEQGRVFGTESEKFYHLEARALESAAEYIRKLNVGGGQ